MFQASIDVIRCESIYDKTDNILEHIQIFHFCLCQKFAEIRALRMEKFSTSDGLDLMRVPRVFK